MSAPNWAHQTVWTGDNLDIMRGMNSESVDLVYLDPPFNSKANYAAPIGSKAAGAAFKDTWTLSDVDTEWINLIEAKQPALYRVLLAAMTPSDKSYLAYMAARLLELRRVLKPTGSIYLHCDPTMSHYLKLVMDSIFGRKQFRNEIVWCYAGGGIPKLDFPRKHDIVFRYTNGKKYFYRPTFRPYSAGTIQRGRTKVKGKYFDQGLRKEGTPVNDWWIDVPKITSPTDPQKVGYPTQKPLALLDRIIGASSNEGDTVLDPFCGCATTCISAQGLHRQWAGIDISPKAAELVQRRMHDELGMYYSGIHRTDIPKRTDIGPLPRYNCAANRQTLYGVQGGNCAGCSTHFETRHLEVDHIISRGKGGTDHLGNLQLMCGSCNRIKGDRGMEYLRVKLQLN